MANNFKALLLLISLAMSGCNESTSTLDELFGGSSSGSGSGSGSSLSSNSIQIGIGNPGYAFGNVSVKSVKTTDIQVKNTSTVPIYLQPIAGVKDINFSTLSNTCDANASPLAAGAQCSVKVQFSPLAAGAFTYYVNVTFGETPGAVAYSSTSSITGSGVALLVFEGVNPIDPTLVSTTQVKLSWTPVTGAASYSVYKAALGGAFELDGFGQSGDSSYTVKYLNPASTYTFQVKALNVLSQEDLNPTTAQTTTDSLGSFSDPPILSVAEGGTITSASLATYCTDSKGHTPTSISITSQTDPDSQCSVLSGPFRIQCSPYYKAGHSAWYSSLTLSCLLNQYPLAYTKTMVVNVSDTNRSPVILALSNLSTSAGVAVSASPLPSDPDGDTLTYSCVYSGTYNGLSTSSTTCGSLLNQNNSQASFSSGTGAFTWTPPMTSAGTTVWFQISASDGTLSAPSTFSTTITAPPPSASQSILSVSSTSVNSGSSVTVTLVAKDSNGNSLTYGGSTVTFSNTGGSSTLSPSSITATDNGNGIYTATLTGLHSGTATTLTAVIQGNTFTGSAPTVTVNPGPISASKSLITVSSPVITSGSTSTLTVIAEDANNNLLTSGGATITLGLTGGSSSGSFQNPATDHGSGTYTSVFTGTTSGSATTVTASINSISFTGSAPTLTVSPGSVSPSNSSLTLSSSTLTAGNTATLTLVLKDSNNNFITDKTQASNLTLTMLATGTSSATFGTSPVFSALVGSDGTYTAVVTGATAGTTNTIRASLSGSGNFSTTPSLTVSPGSVSPTKSTIVSSPSSIPANGTTTSTLTVTLLDDGLNAIAGKTVTLTSDHAAFDTITNSTPISDANGHVSFYVKSTKAETSTYSATDSTDGTPLNPPDVSLSQRQVTFTAGIADALKSTLTVDNSTQIDNGVSAANITVTLVDSHSNAVSNQSVTLTSTRGAFDTISPPSVATDYAGVANFSTTSTHAGTSTYYATTSISGAGQEIGTRQDVIYGLGPVSQSASQVSANPTSVEADNTSQSTITVTLTDDSSNAISGKTLTLASSQGADTILPSFAVTNGSGLATFTVKSSSTHTSTLTVTDTTDSNLNLNTKPTVAFVPLVPNMAHSTLTLSSPTIYKNGTSIATLSLKNVNDIAIPTGIVATPSVSFTASVGTSTGSFGSVNDLTGGIFTSVYTASGKGTAMTVTAAVTPYLGSVSVTNAITVKNSAPSITGGLAGSSTPFTYPISGTPLVQGTTYTLATATDIDAGDSVTLNCTYTTTGLALADINYATASPCSNLPSVVTSADNTSYVGTLPSPTPSPTTNSITWTPSTTQRGTYQFTITPTDGNALGTATPSTFSVTVRENDTISNLIYGLDALDATSALNGLSASTPSSYNAAGAATSGSWLNLFDGTSLQTFTNATWSGTGAISSPYSMSFNGTTSTVDLGSKIVDNSSKFALETWVKPTLPGSAGTVILSNGGGTGNGLALRQSTTPTTKAEFVVGSKYYTYPQLILSQNPSGYWRLDDASGTSAKELSGNGNNGTYPGGITLGVSGGMTNDADTAVSLNSNSISFGTAYNYPASSSFTISYWINPTNITQNTSEYQGTYMGSGNTGMSMGFYLWGGSGSGDGRFYIGVNAIPASGVTAGICGAAGFTDSTVYGAWTHHVYVWNGSVPSLTVYNNGVQVSQLTASSNINCQGGTVTLANAVANYAGNANTFKSLALKASMDEYAIFNYALSSTQVAAQYSAGLGTLIYPGNAVLADSPVGYWRMNEVAGVALNDSSGNGNNGTYTYITSAIGGTSSDTVKLGQTGALINSGDNDTSVYFNGRAWEYASVPYTSTLNSNTFSAEAWVYPKASGTTMSPLASQNATNGFAITATSGNLWQATIGNGTSTTSVTSSATVSTSGWTHLVTTYDGTNLKLYVNASPTPTAATYSPVSSPTPLVIGAGYGTAIQSSFKGYIDEVAIYNYALSPTQVTAHYNSGKGPGWWYCQSKSALSSSNWNLLAAMYDGATGISKLFYNGTQECSVTPSNIDASVTYTQPATDVFTASAPTSTSFWKGLMSTLKFFGTSNGVTPLPTPSVLSDFTSEANRFKTLPVNSLVTTGLVLNLDAANSSGTGPQSGCSPSSSTWVDLSGNSNNGSLLGFSGSCTSDGWTGGGTVGSPYALTLNGTSDFVYIANSLIGSSTTVSITGWLNGFTSGGGPFLTTMGFNNDSNNNEGLWFDYPGVFRVIAANGIPTSHVVTSTASITGSWTHAAIVINSTSYAFYINGVLKSNLSLSGPIKAGSNEVTIGNSRAFSIAALQVYTTALTLQQVKQNCLAQEGLFTATPGKGNLCPTP